MATGVPLRLARTRAETAMRIQTHRDASLDKAHPDPYLMELLAVPPGPVADVNAAIVHLLKVCVSRKLVAPVLLTPLLKTCLPCYSSLK